MEGRSNTRKKLNEISTKTFIIGKCFNIKNVEFLINILDLLISKKTKLQFFNRLFRNSMIYETIVYSSGKKKQIRHALNVYQIIMKKLVV